MSDKKYIGENRITFFLEKIKSKIPTKTSDLTNDSGFLTSHQDISGKMDKTNPVATGSFSLNRKADTTTGAYSFSEGLNNTASGYGSHAEGTVTNATGDYSHTEGYGTTASNAYSHAEGTESVASGYGSHVEGVHNTAGGDYSHAEGYYTTVTSDAAYSHAEGNQTKASGNYSHVEGYISESKGNYSHAEGYNTLAEGHGSHAEGCDTVATGHYSHTSGIGTIAKNNFQTAIGKYNIEDSEDSDDKYALIVGNGRDEDNRSNAFSISWDGITKITGASTTTTPLEIKTGTTDSPTIKFLNKNDGEYGQLGVDGTGIFYTKTGSSSTYLATKSEVNNKVDKVSGKGLSTNDFTTALKNTYDGYATTIGNKADATALGGLSFSLVSFTSLQIYPSGELPLIGGDTSKQMILSAKITSHSGLVCIPTRNGSNQLGIRICDASINPITDQRKVTGYYIKATWT